jgi:hypothetical protein
MAYIGREPQIGNFQVCDAISVVNGQAAYTMQVGGANVSPETANHMLVSLNGVLQAPGSSYTVSGSTITFASNLVTGDVIDFIHILGSVLDLGVPSDSTVSLAKLTATGTKDATTFLRGDNTFAAAGGANTPAFSVYRNGTQSISNNTETKVQYNTENFDTDNNFDNSTNYRYTPGFSGKSFLVASVRLFGATDFDNYTIKISKNGTGVLRQQNSYQHYESTTVSGIVTHNTTDYFEVFISHQYGSSTDVMSGSDVSYFMGYKLIE